MSNSSELDVGSNMEGPVLLVTITLVENGGKKELVSRNKSEDSVTNEVSREGGGGPGGGGIIEGKGDGVGLIEENNSVDTEENGSSKLEDRLSSIIVEISSAVDEKNG